MQVNELLGASYELYPPAGTNDTAILRTVGYALPTVVHIHAQTVVPTTNYASMRTLRQTPRRRFVGAAASLANAASGELSTSLSRRDDDDDEVTLPLLRELYNTMDYEPAAIGKNALGIAGFLNQYASQEDLTMFMEVGRPDTKDATFAIERVNGGGYHPSHPGYEANVNMQYA